jgi:SAM-dependent methyltransferase
MLQMSDMGRFATTASLYAQFRPPYSPEFFRTVAQKLEFGARHRLLDLGTGPGLIALGFAPHVGEVVGVDVEPAMLEAAREAAARAGRDLVLIESPAERLPAEVGPFEVVTIGRALHWMDRDLIGPLLERLVARGGVVLICAARAATDGRNDWLETYNQARRDWSGMPDRTRYRQDLAAVLAGTRFRIGETIAVETSHELSVRDLAYRMLTFSGSSPAVLGDKVDAMLQDVEQRLSRFSRDGLLKEVVIGEADVVSAAPP